MKHIVKREGHVEVYDNHKLYASLYAAVLSVREPVGTAEVIAKEVVQEFEDWLGSKHEVTANDIRRVAGEALRAIHPDAAFQYIHHRVVW
jgi:hypothetical protein